MKTKQQPSPRLRSRRAVSQAIPAYRDGRDEMNLVEFPLALLSERAPQGVCSLEFSDEIREQGLLKQRQVSIVATPKYGLPTATDEDILMGLLQLAKLQNEFSTPVVYFTRLQLIQILGWQNTKWSYDRIRTSLYRWRTVTVTYTNAWRDNAKKLWTDQGGFGLIDSFNLRDSRQQQAAPEEDTHHSWFRWSGFLFESFRSGYLKKLNYPLYRALNLQAAKRLYRYLDKHFYEPFRLSLSFDLRQLCCEHLGMSRNYDTAQIRRRLQPAVEELEAIGFLVKVSPQQRYRKLGHGHWQVRFHKPRAKQTKKPTRSTARQSQQDSHRQTVEKYLASLSPAQRQQLEQQAWQQADGFLLQSSQARDDGPLAQECRRLVLQQYVLKHLHKNGNASDELS